VHTHGSGGRRRGKPRSRILYWFRTPPGVRIGRSALDEDAIRLIEEHNPDVEFDWTRILKGQEGTGGQTPATEGQTPGTDGRPPRSARGSGQPERRSRPRMPEVEATQDTEEAAVPVVEAMPQVDEITDFAPAVEEIAVQQPEDTAVAIETADAAVVEQFLVEPRVEPPVPRPQAGDALSAVEARLGSEGLSRLRARYSEILARISETISDPARQEELKATAERLNPDTWVTEMEVRAGLEDYETVFESLRSVVGRRRRRGRRSPNRQPGRGPEESQAGSAVIEEDEEGLDEPGPVEQQ
jgi:hypothetical protein